MQLLASNGEEQGEGGENGGFAFALACLSICLSQAVMVAVAGKVKASEIFGRKVVFQAAILTLLIRCCLLCLFSFVIEAGGGGTFLNCLVFSCNALDGAAVGMFNVIFVLITADLVPGDELATFIGVVRLVQQQRERRGEGLVRDDDKFKRARPPLLYCATRVPARRPASGGPYSSPTY